MLLMNKKLMMLGLFVLLQACSHVDDYMLGKDNTPKPEKLEPIQSKVQLTQDWSAPIGKPSKSSSYLKLKPVVIGNVIYTADPGGLVQAMDKKTATVLWSQQLKHGILSGPSVGNGFVALGTNTSSIVLLKQSNGEQVWQAKISSDSLSKPVITNEKVVVKTINGHLYALDLKNGEKIWVADHGAPNLILKASASPVIFNHLALVGFSDGKLDAVDLQSGNVVWQRGVAYASGASDVERLVDIDSDPIVRGDKIFLASYQGYIGALSLKNGEFVWKKPASTYKNLAIDQNTLYMTDSDDIVWAFDQTSGHVRWKQIALKARGLTEPVLLNGRLVLGDKTGYLHVLSTQTGSLVSRAALNAPISIDPTVSENSIYVVTENGQLNRFSVS